MAAADETINPLEKYRAIFVRKYQICFAHLPDESQRVEAISRIFGGVKTTSELANVALNLRALLMSSPHPLAATLEPANADETPDESTADLARHGSASPDFVGGDKTRERPAQSKLAQEIESVNKKIYELFERRKLRELNANEQNEMRTALSIREELRKRLKKTQDAATRAKRYRTRKAYLMSTDSDVGLESPASKFSRSLSSNLLMSSDEELQSEGREQLWIRTRPAVTSFDDSLIHSIGLTPTPELNNLKISPALFVKTENVQPEVGSSSNDPDSVTEKNRDSSTTTDSESANPQCQCQNCFASFATLNEFIDHMRTTHLNPESELSCRHCDRQFSSAQGRLVHLTEHFTSTSATYECQRCKKVFSSASNFRQHFTSTHTEILFRCNVCLRVFTDNGVYQEHMNVHASEEMVIACAVCLIQFDNEDRFLSHIQLVHDREDDSLVSAVANQENGQPASLGLTSTESNRMVKNLKCFVCDERYVDEIELDTHRLLNHCKVPRSDRCAVCRQPMADLEDFFAHTKEHCADQSEVSCVVCRQTVRNETLLKMHGEHHLGQVNDQRVICQLWSKAVPAELMTNHILHHTLDQTSSDRNEFSVSTNGSFVCQCGQKFDDAHGLQVHSLEHLKEVTTIAAENETGPFVCPKCPKIFASLSALQGHSAVHAMRKFSCSKCRQVFSTQTRLQSHLKRHTLGRVKCQICDQKFKDPDSLSQHMRTHAESLTTVPISSDRNN